MIPTPLQGQVLRPPRPFFFVSKTQNWPQLGQQYAPSFTTQESEEQEEGTEDEEEPGLSGNNATKSQISNNKLEAVPPQIELKEKDEEDVKEKSEEKKEEEEGKDEEEEEEEKDKEEQEDEGIELDSNSDSTASHQGQKFIKAVPV